MPRPGDSSNETHPEPESLVGVVDRLLAPEELAEERRRLSLNEAQSPDKADSVVSGWSLGYMEGVPSSLALRSGDARAKELIDAIKDSPKLAARHFLREFEVQELINHGDEGHRIMIAAVQDDPPIEVPLDNFVSAQGFRSWEEGRGGVDKVDKTSPELARRTSQATVEEYANRSTQAPPIEAVSGFVQPNGLVLFVTEMGSHRTAAAIYRGDATIRITRLILARLNQDYLGLEHAK